jgi:hypothetical protein
MWGSSQVLTVSSGAVGPANNTVSSAQLVKINYRRPETWRFLFWGRIVGGDLDPAAVTSVHALFDVFVGVGRSVLDTQKTILGVPANFNSFVQFRWNVPIATQPGQQNNNIKYTTVTGSPVLDDASGATRLIEHLVAEDLSCRVRFVMSGGSPGVDITAELGAFFAPNVHVRPDWFAADPEVPQFPGGEAGGT